MAASSIQLPWGPETLSLDLPSRWKIAGVLEPSALPGVPDPEAAVRQALLAPISMPRLSELVEPGMRIALVIDDGSRPTPVARLLPAVIEELCRAGINLADVTVVPALGVHRPMSQEELAARLGGAWLEKLRWEMPDCDDPAKLAFLGTTSRGTPVYLNRVVAEADLIVSIGCIEPHIIASFGGGYKNLVPGVAGRATIAHNHALNCQTETFNMVGQPIESNPMRLDLEEAAALVGRAIFLINAVLNSSLEVVDVVCGHPISAHRKGTEISARIYGVAIPAPADVVITTSHPMDQDLRQGVKALANTIRAVKPGGTLITLIRAEEGVGVFGLANRKLPVGRTVLKWIAPLLLPRVAKLKLKGMGEEDRFFLYFALQTMIRCQALMYAPTIPAEIQSRLPFVRFVNQPQKAIAVAARRSPEAAVLVFPHGGMTYPILPE
ncbi:MAG TPA: nickel-dependent lactate racemase [Anaerolineaceae bacterium]|nr:nickel-dependent lactate racemase [Anaerolineaceae bacterium]